MNHTCNCGGKMCGNRHLGLFILRVVTGVILAYAGWEKLQNMAGVQGSFAALHFPAFMAYAVTWVELIGGIALILGLFTCLASAILAIVMAVAVVVAWRAGGFSGAQFALLVLAALLTIKHAGRGKWGIGRHCGCPGTSWGGMKMGGNKGNVCVNCGHNPSMGEGCDCACHK